MAKSLIRKLLEKKQANTQKSGRSYGAGSLGKFGNSQKAITPAQKHKGKM